MIILPFVHILIFILDPSIRDQSIGDNHDIPIRDPLLDDDGAHLTIRDALEDPETVGEDSDLRPRRLEQTPGPVQWHRQQA